MNSSDSHKSESPAKEPAKPRKLFVTGLDGKTQTKELEEILKAKFSKYGQFQNFTLKRSYNETYSYAFIDYEVGVDASIARKELDNQQICGKHIKVDFQDDSRKRKGGNTPYGPRKQSCYNCGKYGHFAKDCKRQDQRRERRRRSRSYDRRQKRRRRYSSSSERWQKKRRYSSSSERSYRRRRDKRKSEKEKSKKKFSKNKRRYSDSESSR